MSRALLRELNDWKLKDEDRDIRGKTLKASDGRSLGNIRDMIADTDTRQVEAVVLDNGAEYPLRSIDLRNDGSVVLAGEGSRFEGGRFESGRQTGMGGAGAAQVREGEIRIPVIEERITVGKKTVTEGAVRVTSDVTEQAVDEDVTLRSTHVHVERQPADRPATQADMEAARRGGEFVETHEVADVEKTARVVEEVVISKDVDEKTEHIHDKVRRSRPEVENIEGEEKKPRKP